jgi:hypothetical protein
LGGGPLAAALEACSTAAAEPAAHEHEALVGPAVLRAHQEAAGDAHRTDEDQVDDLVPGQREARDEAEEIGTTIPPAICNATGRSSRSGICSTARAAYRRAGCCDAVRPAALRS